MAALDDAKQHALEAYPGESCGLIVAVDGRERYYRCTNKAASKNEHFVIGGKDYAFAEDMGEVVGVVHSHPDERARPSVGDQASCESSGLPWTILSVMKGEIAEIHQFAPSGVVWPLEGRPFAHGVMDCYTLIKDWWGRERGITLPDFERHDNWWNDGHSNLYMDHFREAGFEPIGQYPDLEVGDVILMQIRSKNGVPNHAGVYVGDGMILHHMYGRLSCKVIYGGILRDYTRLVVRYKRNGE